MAVDVGMLLARAWAGITLLAIGTCAAQSSGWSSRLASVAHEVVPRYTLGLSPVSHDFRPTHTDYQLSMLVLSIAAVAGCLVLVLGLGGYCSILGAGLLRLANGKRRRETRRRWRTCWWASTTATLAFTGATLFVGVHLSTVSEELGHDASFALQPVQNLSEEVGSALVSNAQGLLEDSERAYPHVMSLRLLALSLAPRIDALHASADQLLGVLGSYSNARELDRLLNQLMAMNGATIRDLPRLFPPLRDQLRSLDTDLLSPIRPPLASLNQEIAALQQVVDLQAIKELQFGMFFFMSFENSVISDIRCREVMLQWLDSVEQDIRPILLAKQQRLVTAVLSNRAHYTSPVVHQAQVIEQSFLRTGKALEAVQATHGLIQALPEKPDPEVQAAVRDLSQALDQRLGPRVPKEAKELRNGIAFLEDRDSIKRAQEKLVAHQFAAYRHAMQEVESAEVASLLNTWNRLNREVRARMGDVSTRWTEYSAQLAAARRIVDDRAVLWWIYAHSLYVLLLVIFLVTSVAFIFPRLMWLVVLLLMLTGLWCALETGVYLPASIAVADYCAAPEDSVVLLLRGLPGLAQQLDGLDLEVHRFSVSHASSTHALHRNGSGGAALLESSTRYYLQCQGDNLLAPALEYAAGQLRQATDQLDQLANYTLAVPSSLNATRELRVVLADGESRLLHVRKMSNCSTIRNPFAEVNSVLCGNLLRESLHLLLGRVVMVLLTSLALFFGWMTIAAHANHIDSVGTKRPLLWPDDLEAEALLSPPTDPAAFQLIDVSSAPHRQCCPAPAEEKASP